jgi:hypothetical protein
MDPITITLTQDELSTLEYMVSQEAFSDIPEVQALAEVIYQAIWASNTEPFVVEFDTD